MGSGLILLPILIRFLSPDELGLWYTLTAISNLTTLFEFGFNPTFARNIVYCLSGVHNLKSKDLSERSEEVDWHLTAAVIKTCKVIYAAISLIAILAVGTVGTAYISAVTDGLTGNRHWVAWGIFVVSMFINLFYLWTLTVLRGCGDIAGENRAKTFSRVIQLIVTLVLCAAGTGIIGAAIGYLSSGLSLRIFSWGEVRKHRDVYRYGLHHSETVSWTEIKDVLQSVSGLTAKDGIVELSLFLATQSTSLLCSYYLGLTASGTYSVQLQLANAVSSFSAVYVSSCYPTYQSAYARKALSEMRAVVEKGFVAYWICAAIGVLGVGLFVFPLLTIIKPDTQLDLLLYLAMALYSCIVQQTTCFCALIAATNRIPYYIAYPISSVTGVVLSAALISAFGAWGLVVGQAAAQVVYNVWKWPRFVLKELGLTPLGAIEDGLDRWMHEIQKIKGKSAES